MELAINNHNFKYTDYKHIFKKLKRNRGPIMKRLRIEHQNKFLYFKKWFEKEHDYCLPIKNRNILVTEEYGEDYKDNSYMYNSTSVNLKTTNLEKMNVNNELSSSSVYAIDVTTELLKDALLENKKNQLNYEQTNLISKKCNNSSNNCSLNIVNQPNQNDVISRTNNENLIQPIDNKIEKSCVSRECTPPKSFSLMDIDSDMIKLFPSLDFAMEHSSNGKLKNNENKIIITKNIDLSLNTELMNNESVILSNTSHAINVSKSSQPLLTETVKNECKVDIIQPKLTNDLTILSNDNSASTINQLVSKQYISIFNRYQSKSKPQIIEEQVVDPGPVLLKDLLCGSKPKTIISPYTHRYLRPFIYRDSVTKPLWLRMLNELKEHFRHKNGLPKCVETETIDYSYIRAKHIKSVNVLARQFFWPGIDLTESLLYPDFSIIALYKNLVIGFGFMVPDICTNENYLTFLFTRPYWTNCGIAKFMIYHLIQTCMTRDITLHVSPNNPAMILYQKFGFKIEGFVQNFYENYIPTESEMSKHALFLRLRSTLQKK